MMSASCASPNQSVDQVQEPYIDYSLIRLHEEYLAHTSNHDRSIPFKSDQKNLRVTNGFVNIDAIARSDAEKLADDLKVLGAKVRAVAGLYVSCDLPIESIPALDGLVGLRSARPVMSTTDH